MASPFRHGFLEQHGTLNRHGFLLLLLQPGQSGEFFCLLSVFVSLWAARSSGLKISASRLKQPLHFSNCFLRFRPQAQ